MTGKDLLLSIQELTKSYGQLNILRNVSFDVNKGEVVGIVGPSGGGKSSLLRCLSGLTSIDSGVIDYKQGTMKIAAHDGENIYYELLDGETKLSDPDFLARFRRQIGLVFQKLNLWGDMTVLENLCLAPSVILKEDKAKIIERAEELCKNYGLGDKVKQRVWKLSGGQQQRVALMRALMMNPELLLLDEITSSLDPFLASEVMDSIRALRDGGQTFILVTHHLEFATSICDQIFFVGHGNCVAFDDYTMAEESHLHGEMSKYLKALKAVR